MTREDVYRIAIQYCITNSIALELFDEMHPDTRERDFEKTLKQLQPFGDVAVQTLTVMLKAENWKYNKALESMQKANELCRELLTNKHSG